MRPIVIISSFGLDGPQMASVRLNRLSRLLKARGHEVTVLTPGRISGGSGKLARKLLFPFVAAWLAWRKSGDPAGADIVSTIPEVEAFLAGALVKAARGRSVALTLEVRDPFSMNALYPWGRIRRRFYRTLERLLLRGPDRAIFLTREIERMYLKHFGSLGPWCQCRQVITNGFEPSTALSSSPRTGRPLRIAHIGNFYGSRNPVTFLEVLARYIGEGHDGASLEVVLAGAIHGRELQARVKTLLQSEPLKSGVTWRGPVPQAEAARLMNESDVNLIITHDSGSEYAVPGKIFEYMGAGKPVLALTRDPPLVSLLVETRLGWICRDADELLHWFKRWLAQPEEIRRHQIDEEAVRSYHSDRILARWEAFVTTKGAP